MIATAAPARPTSVRGVLMPVVTAGLAGGAVDGLYASIAGLVRGRSVMRVWQGVAAGWLGKSAADGGLATMMLGLATHFAIVICMAAAFAGIASRAPALYRHRLVAGALYGVGLYLVMYRLVLPLRWPAVFPRWDGWISVADIASHVGVGIAIAVVLSSAYGDARNR